MLSRSPLLSSHLVIFPQENLTVRRMSGKRGSTLCTFIRDNGQQITMLTLSHRGDIEQPLMFDLKDTKRLATDMLISLATHGDETAREILDKYFAATGEGN